MRLVLFDIDGTLITDRGNSRDAFARALREVYAYEDDLGRYDFSGRTDPQIAHMVLRDAGHDAASIDARIDELWRIYLEQLEANLGARHSRILPGISELLD